MVGGVAAFLAVLILVFSANRASRQAASSSAEPEEQPEPPARQSVQTEGIRRTAGPCTPSLAAGSTLLPGAGRPTGGKALWRCTDAWLHAHGLFEGRAIERNTAIQIAGETAVRYHLRQGNFQEQGSRISLTPEGRAFFLARRRKL